MSMIVDGRQIAKDILKEVKDSLKERRPLVRIIVMQPSGATESYLKIKQTKADDAGMDLEIVRIEDGATTVDVVESVELPGADAVVVQLPLPSHIDTEAVLAAIPQDKDADVLGKGTLMPPVAGAVKEILARAGVEISGKRAVVVGRGRLVGAPSLKLLQELGAETTSIDIDTPDPGTILKEADIIVSGAGDPHFITPNMVKEGAVLIDAGASELAGSIAGDFHPDCAHKASVFTPVPGGVGPIAVSMLFKNAAALTS